jgi:molybdopterin synthase catalytic subunit
MEKWITDSPLNLEQLLKETEDQSCGGLVIFSGTIRNNNDGKDVVGISYDAHVTIAENSLRELEIEILGKFSVEQCRIQHRIGKLVLGEPSVYVVVRSIHRAEAFEAAQYGIDELKRRLPVWKEEHYKDGASEFLKGVPIKTSDETS